MDKRTEIEKMMAYIDTAIDAVNRADEIGVFLTERKLWGAHHDQYVYKYVLNVKQECRELFTWLKGEYNND